MCCIVEDVWIGITPKEETPYNIENWYRLYNGANNCNQDGCKVYFGVIEFI